MESSIPTTPSLTEAGSSSATTMHPRDVSDPRTLAAREFSVLNTDFPPKVERFIIPEDARSLLDTAVRISPARISANATPGLLPDRVLVVTPADTWQPFAGLIIVDYGTTDLVSQASIRVETVVLIEKGETIRALVESWHSDYHWLSAGPERTPVRPFASNLQGAMDLEVDETPARAMREKDLATQNMAQFAVDYVLATRNAKLNKRFRMMADGEPPMQYDDEELDKQYLRDVMEAVARLGHFWVQIFGY